MFKVPEVAKQLNCSISTVYGLVDAGKLVAYRIGVGRGALRITESDLLAFLESCRTKKAERTPKPSRPRPHLEHIRLRPLPASPVPRGISATGKDVDKPMRSWPDSSAP